MGNATVSVVIPAFNEEKTILNCLASLSGELDDLLEVIVVDNNSSDRTATLVAEFAQDHPKVRLLAEPRPGVISARNAGFDTARGSVIARLDADAMARPGWARAIVEVFENGDANIGAATGPFDNYDLPLPRFRALLRRLSVPKGEPPQDVFALFGANMAVRRSTWKAIRDHLLDVPGVFDDLDIALCVQDQAQRTVYVAEMDSLASGRRMLNSRKDYWKFTGYLPNTYLERGMHEEAKQSRPNVWIQRTLYLAFWVPVRVWDPISRRVSLKYALSKHEQRVLPFADQVA